MNAEYPGTQQPLSKLRHRREKIKKKKVWRIYLPRHGAARASADSGDKFERQPTIVDCESAAGDHREGLAVGASR